MRIRQGPLPGSAAEDITRGVIRLMGDLGYARLTEFKLTSRRRVDVAALDRAGRFVVVACVPPRGVRSAHGGVGHRERSDRSPRSPWVSLNEAAIACLR